MSVTSPPRPPNAQAVDSYAAIDYSIRGPIAADLFQAIEDEAKLSRISLSDHTNSTPADITQRMVAWYRTNVEGPRKAALGAIKGSATSGTKKAGAGIFLEQQLDTIEHTRIEAKRQIVTQHRERHQADYERLEGARTDLETAQYQFETRRRENGREPTIVKWWYYVVLVLIGIVEVFINFDSFGSISYFTPAFAAGTSIIIAFALALSSHCWGTLVRRFAVLFNPAEDDKDRLAVWTMMGLGSLTLSVVLGAVWWARESYFADRLLEIIALGGEEPDKLGIIGGSMLTNIVVWIVGVLWAYFLHDPDPRFPKAYEDMQKKDRVYTAQREALDKELQYAFMKKDAVATRDMKTAHTTENSLQNNPEHQLARRLFERVSAQDANVMGVLETYRSMLVSRVDERFGGYDDGEGGNKVFDRHDLVSDDKERLTPQEYAALPLRIKYV